MEQYERPEVKLLGTVEELTANHGGPHFDKIGSIDDVLTPILGLDGEILPD